MIDSVVLLPELNSGVEALLEIRLNRRRHWAFLVL
jgi:hypothetical protein